MGFLLLLIKKEQDSRQVQGNAQHNVVHHPQFHMFSTLYERTVVSLLRECNAIVLLICFIPFEGANDKVQYLYSFP